MLQTGRLVGMSDCAASWDCSRRKARSNPISKLVQVVLGVSDVGSRLKAWAELQPECQICSVLCALCVLLASGAHVRAFVCS